MTDSQKQMCGCEDCIIANDMVTNLNAWNTRQLNRMEQDWKLLPDPPERTTKEAKWRNFRDAVLFDGKHRFQRAKDAMRCMTCAPVGNTDLNHIKCALGRCLNCPAYDVPERQQSDNVADENEITFHVYEKLTICS